MAEMAPFYFAYQLCISLFWILITTFYSLNLENLQSGEFNDSQSNNDMDNQSQRSGTTSINLDALGVHNKKISKNEKR
jgi:hypothetical protein